jgi:5'-phosphate synthase pdxT subunit
MDTKIGRNAFAPKESFEADLDVQGFDHPYRAVLFRPAIVDVGGGVRCWKGERLCGGGT